MSGCVCSSSMKRIKYSKTFTLSAQALVAGSSISLLVGEVVDLMRLDASVRNSAMPLSDRASCRGPLRNSSARAVSPRDTNSKNLKFETDQKDSLM